MVVATGSKAGLVLRRAPHSKVTASIHEAFSHSRFAQDDSRRRELRQLAEKPASLGRSHTHGRYVAPLPQGRRLLSWQLNQRLCAPPHESSHSAPFMRQLTRLTTRRSARWLTSSTVRSTSFRAWPSTKQKRPRKNVSHHKGYLAAGVAVLAIAGVLIARASTD